MRAKLATNHLPFSPHRDAAVFKQTTAEENGNLKQEKPLLMMLFFTLEAFSFHLEIPYGS